MESILVLAQMHRALEVGSRICNGGGFTAYAHLLVQREQETQSTLGIGGWMNLDLAKSTQKTETSRAPMVAAWKATELVAAISKGDGRTSLATPTTLEGGSGWQGGILSYRGGFYAVGVLGLDQSLDKGMAAIMMNSMFNSPREFHIGDVRRRGDDVTITCEGPDNEVFLHHTALYLSRTPEKMRGGRLKLVIPALGPKASPQRFVLRSTR